jgi:7-carboxy-7-deazaguanine synthase
LAAKIKALWPANSAGKPFVVCTGGEPAIQLDQALVEALHEAEFEIAIETNGTLHLAEGIDWVCCSPKGGSEVTLERCNELKMVFPQDNAMPDEFDHITADYYYLTPMAPIDIKDLISPCEDDLTKRTIQYCLDNPKWRLNLQTHKVLSIA